MASNPVRLNDVESPTVDADADPRLSESMTEKFHSMVDSSLEELSIIHVMATKPKDLSCHEYVVLWFLFIVTLCVSIIVPSSILVPFMFFTPSSEICPQALDHWYDSKRACAAILLIYLGISMTGNTAQVRIFSFFACAAEDCELKEFCKGPFALAIFAKSLSILMVMLTTWGLFILSPDPADMLLNSVALSFVLEADTLVLKMLGQARRAAPLV